MQLKLIAAPLTLLIVGACAPSTPLSTGPTASSIAVQPKDLPSGSVKCDLSGDIDSFISKEATPDPGTSKTTKTYWEDAKKKGATDAYVAFYTDSTSHCADIKPAGTAISTANYRVVLNFVVKFKDEATAAKGYTNEKIFGFSAADLKTADPKTVVEGTKTGLTQNSIVVSTPLPNQTLYIAEWQKKAFIVILVIFNMDPAASAKVATSENSRIT
jgi:hypothetical protein